MTSIEQFFYRLLGSGYVASEFDFNTFTLILASEARPGFKLVCDRKRTATELLSRPGNSPAQG